MHYSKYCVLYFQIQFSVNDTGYPPNTGLSFATGTIDIYKNEFAPEFSPTNYITFIQEETVENSVVYDFNATDGDTDKNVLIFLSGFRKFFVNTYLDVNIFCC